VIRLNRLRARLTQSLNFEFRPNFLFIGSAIERALRNRLAAEDSETKKAVVIDGSRWLASVLGLKKTRILDLRYPDFTIENLALLSDEYDFIIADRVLHRCRSAEDAARETMRILRPGGWFVHTTSILDFALASPIDRRRLGPRGLHALVPHQGRASAAGWGNPLARKTPSPGDTPAGWAAVSWIVGQKLDGAPAIVPSVTTRKARRSVYRYRPRPAKFGVVAITRNEAPYLLEWIAHYRALGFGQITIYDNCSNDASAEILAPLAKAGIINARFWTDRPAKQNKAYNQAVRRLRPYVEWCLFADLDEFLVLEEGRTLEDLLPQDTDVAAVAILTRWYGSAGIRNREVGLTIERFTKTSPRNTRVVKSLVRLRDVRWMDVHLPSSIDGRVADLQGRTVEKLPASSLPWLPDGPARINHYYNRSWEEFECKRARGYAPSADRPYSVNSFDTRGPGKVEPLDTLRLAPAVKEEIARLRRIVGWNPKR
jgi:SAM-dependent methyltransferase